MSTITTIQSSDLITNSRAVINTNFSNLNTDKMEKSSNLSDVTVPATARNNILPTQATYGGKVLGTDGTNVSWVDPSGSALATQSVQGITALSVAAVDPLLPKALGENDGRVLTQAENDACAGTGTPSSSNKFVTADTDALKELLSNKATSTSLGTSDSLYPSQNAVKVYVDTLIAAASPTVKNGTTTQDISSSTTTNIAHGLGRTPKKVRLTSITATSFYSIGSYDGTTQSLIYNANGSVGTSSTYTIWCQSSTNTLRGVVTVDGTNIIITWTMNGSPTGTAQIMWEVQ